MRSLASSLPVAWLSIKLFAKFDEDSPLAEQSMGWGV